MMRLKSLQRGIELKNRIKVRLLQSVIGAVPGIAWTLFYRPGFFGNAMGKLHNAVIRGKSDWSVGERELFSAFVSSKNQCRYCIDAHGAAAGRVLGQEVVKRAMAEVDCPVVTGKARAMLGFLEKLTMTPQQVSQADIQKLREAKISDEAIRDGVYICALFATFNRIVFSTGVEPMTPKQLQALSFIMVKFGYDV
jgi:uncharacterized peroxidase-related enzyme